TSVCSYSQEAQQRDQLQSRFTWNLRKEDMDMESLSTRLKEHIKLQLGRPGAVALSYSFLAYVRYLQNQPEEALSLLLQSEQKTRECYGEESERRLIVTYGDLAWLKYHTGYYLESVILVPKKYPSSSSTVLHPEVYGEQGWTYLKFSKSLYPKAIECFLSALEIQKDDSEWNAGYAIALFRTERHKEASLEINPDDAVLLSMLSVKLGAYKKHEEAESLVEKALKTDPENPHVLRYIAKYLRNQGENDRSIDLLERALKRTSQSAFIHHQLGLCYKKKKIAEQSSKPYKKQMVQQLRHQCIRNLEKAVKIKPSFALARADLALMYGEDKDFDRAEEMFQHCFKMIPEIPDESVCQVIHQRYAEFHFYHTKKPADAIDHYKKVISEIELLQMIPSAMLSLSL
uniref:Interferon-induced protein with tetratricopeptide repeats 5 n=1 Tax=Fundulus heteroclitus TaxID=8078 RepID=A0A3Q2Q1A6_FUNHE